MVHATYRFPSRILGRNTIFHVLLPKPQSLFVAEERAFSLDTKPCLWFFHGIGDDAEAVLLHTEIAEICDELDLIVILPSVENTFCLDLADSLRFRGYLRDELIPYTARVLPLSPERERHMIGGISMGGYGACSLGLEQPEFFSKIFCLSGALDLKTAARFSRACGITLPEPLTAKVGNVPPEWELLASLERCADTGGPLPALYLTCAKLDSVYKSNVRFTERAMALGFSVEMHNPPGLHEWKFWRENLRAAVEWALRDISERTQ